MKILIVGSGGREHAIAVSAAKSPKADKIYCAPGNAGIGQIAECVPIGAMEFDKLVAFAVKEAVAKSFGTGFRGFWPGDIEVLRDELGKPYVILHGEAERIGKELRISRIHVSISNTKEYAVAYVTAETEF